MSQQLDAIDTIATKAFEGYVVRKDLVRKFKGQYPVPTYVAEFLLGRYCASVDDEEIAEGLKIVERQLGEKTVRAGEQELFKARAKEKGHVKLIDIITARLDAETDSFRGDAAEPAAEGRADQRSDGPRQRADAHGRLLRRGRARLRPDHRPGEERPPVRHRVAARDPAVQARRAAGAVPGPGGVHHRGVEGFPDPQHRHGAGAAHRRAPAT